MCLSWFKGHGAEVCNMLQQVWVTAADSIFAEWNFTKCIFIPVKLWVGLIPLLEVAPACILASVDTHREGVTLEAPFDHQA